MKKILFICTGNTCRSPMAEMIFKSLQKGIKVSSAGLCAEGGAMADMAVQTLKNNNCKATVFKSKQVNEKMLSESDMTICMTQTHKDALKGFENVYTLDELTGCGDISDPYGGNEEVYQKCFDELKKALTILAGRKM